MRRIISVVCVIAMLMLLSGCGGDKSNLPGKWYLENNDTLCFTFYSDGTCKVRGEYGTCEWDIVDGQLKIINAYKQSYASKYELNGDKLVINNNTFVRK